MRTASSKAKRQSKLMNIIGAPIRTLAKARNFYMRGLEECAGQVVSYGGGGMSGYTASQVPCMPRSFSVNSSASRDDEDLRQLLRAASSTRSNVGKENNDKSVGKPDVDRRAVVRQQPSGMGRRSYSVGLKMGRIDEEMACSFEEQEVNVKVGLYPRSKSYAVNYKRRNVGFAYT